MYSMYITVKTVKRRDENYQRKMRELLQHTLWNY